MSVETVSLCVIALNEEKFLPNLLNDLFLQTYPHNKTQIVLVDSGSSDATRSIMESFAAEHADEYMGITVADNPKRIQAAGWNVAISCATADVVIRIDAHTHIPADFTAKNMKLQQSGEYVTGGTRPCMIETKSVWADVLLETENSLFGSSANISRRGTQKEYVKTMFHAAYRRDVFQKVGGFNENLLRTEDNEMHYRIRQKGYKLCFDPEIISYQYARSSLKRMIKQKYANGIWVGLTLGVCPGCVSLFHLVPLAFVLAIIATTVLAVLGYGCLSALMWCAYGIFTLLGVAAAIISRRSNWLVWIMPVLFLILHVSYGVGSLVGLLKMPHWKKHIYKKN